MKRIYKLLVTLKDSGLSKTYNNSIDSLEHLKLSLSDVKNEIDDKIIDLIVDSKYIEVNQLTSIPIMIQEVISEINSQILSKFSSVLDNIDIDLVHEQGPSQSNKVNISEVNCISNNLHLIETEDENIENEVELYNYDIAISKELKRLLHTIETILYRNNKNIDKVLCSEYYRYTVDKKRLCNIGWSSKYLNIYFYIPEGEMEDKKGLLKLNKGHHIRGTYKLRVDRSIALEDVEYYILQALKYDK